MSSSSGTPTFSLTSSQTASASPAIETGAAKIAWETALYLIVTFFVVAIVAAIIILVGRVDWTIPTPWREKPEMEPRTSPSPDSTFHLPSAFMLVEMMIRFFSTTFLPAFQSLRTATTSSMSMGAPSQPQPILPLFAETGFMQPVLTAPGPVVPRDNSFRVPSNPYTGSSHSQPTLPTPAH